MNISTLKIQTLGCFSMSVDGKTVATDWPDESIKTLFCSLLSPLDLYFSWDRICRSMFGAPVTPTSMRRLEKIVRPLNSFLIKVLGFNPLISGSDGLRIDRGSVYVDVFEFYSLALEGLCQLSLAGYAAAIEKFRRADSLYAGTYLPGMPGKIIANTRNDLECLYLTVEKKYAEIKGGKLTDDSSKKCRR